MKNVSMDGDDVFVNCIIGIYRKEYKIFKIINIENNYVSWPLCVFSLLGDIVNETNVFHWFKLVWLVRWSLFISFHLMIFVIKKNDVYEICVCSMPWYIFVKTLMNCLRFFLLQNTYVCSGAQNYLLCFTVSNIIFSLIKTVNSTFNGLILIVYCFS